METRESPKPYEEKGELTRREKGETMNFVLGKGATVLTMVRRDCQILKERREM